MAAIDDLISQIEDKDLRERLKSEAKRLTKAKKFGLVFEDHLPELMPVYAAKIRNGSLVAVRGGQITDLWRVVSIKKNVSQCVNRGTNEKKEFNVKELCVVRQFGEPIFPSLTPVSSVQNGPKNSGSTSSAPMCI